MANVEQEHRRPYVSCIRSFGRPILPPLMTDEKRRLMRHFRALACEREAARDKRKKEVLLGTLHEAELEPVPLDDDDLGDSLDVSQLSSLSLGGGAPPPLPPTGLLMTSLGGGLLNSTPDTGSSATLVPSSANSDCEGGDTETDRSSSFMNASFLASEVPQGDKVRSSEDQNMVSSTVVKPVTTLLTTSEVTPVVTPTKPPTTTPIVTPMETPAVTPVTLPIGDGCFSAKLSVPSLCRSRSFVVERPSLARLLWKEQCRDGCDGLDGVNVKIVVEPQKSPGRVSFQQSPERREPCGDEGQVDIAQHFKVSEAFLHKDGSDVGISSMDDRSVRDGASQRTHAETPSEMNSECVQTASAHDLNNPDLYFHTDTSNEAPVPEPVDVPIKIDRTPNLLDKQGSAHPRFVSCLFSNNLGGPILTDFFASQKTVDEIFNVPANSSSKLTSWKGPSSSLSRNPFEGITVIRNLQHANDRATDNTLSDIPNVLKENDSAEETAEDVFADALDDGGEGLTPASATSFVSKGKTFRAVWASYKLGKTLVSDADQGDTFFVPVSASSHQHSFCSSGSGHSSLFSGEKDFDALNSSCDAEDEEQYEDADERPDRGANTSEYSDGMGSTQNSLTESSTSSCGQQMRYLEQHASVDDSVVFINRDHQAKALHDTRAQDIAGGHQGTVQMPPVPPAAVVETAENEDGSYTDDSALALQRASSVSPTYVRGKRSAEPVSLPADPSSLSCWDANQSHAADTSSLTSVHLDLLSETRESLHPRWRRCFDRLTAMARGHLTRRLMKTHRVRSIIQTIKDTLECALKLHGEPHIRSGLVTPQDVELHQRLIIQLTSACHEIHDVFFNIPMAERMQLIAQLRAHRTRPPTNNTRSGTDRGARKISSATQKVLERRISRLAGQDPRAQTRRPTAVVRAQTFVVTSPSDTCHTAGAAPPSGTTRKICRLPMYKV